MIIVFLLCVSEREREREIKDSEEDLSLNYLGLKSISLIPWTVGDLISFRLKLLLFYIFDLVISMVLKIRSNWSI